MQLRNRKSTNSPRSEWTFWQAPEQQAEQKKQEQEKHDQIDALLRNYEETLPANVTGEARAVVLRQKQEFFEQNWQMIEKCKNPAYSEYLQEEMSKAIAEAKASSGQDLSRLNRILSQFKQAKPGTKQQTNDIPSVITHFAKTIGLGAMSAYFPYLTLGLTVTSLLVPAAAQSSSDLVSHGGIPAGGKNLCGGASYCHQGWISTLSGELVTQFNILVQQVSGTLNLGALWQMNRCMTKGLAASIAIDTLGTTPANGSEIIPTCLAKSDTLFGYQASSELTNIGTATCNAFQNNFPAMTSGCINSGDAYGLNVAIAVMIIGGISVIACAIGGACYLAKSSRCNSCPCSS